MMKNLDLMKRRTFLKAGIALTGLTATAGGLQLPALAQDEEPSEYNLDTFLDEWEQVGTALMPVVEDEERFNNTVEAFLEGDSDRFLAAFPDFPDLGLPDFRGLCHWICLLFCQWERVRRCFPLCPPLEFAFEFEIPHLRPIAMGEVQIWSDRGLMESVLAASEQGDDAVLAEVIDGTFNDYVMPGIEALEIPDDFLDLFRDIYCHEFCWWVWEYICRRRQILICGPLEIGQ